MMKPRTTVRRRYRVVKELPWIEGGRPAPGFQWEGGRAVIYKPGDTVVVEDREVICGSLYRKLEALDEVGCSLLEAARAKADAPARITAVADLHPRAVEWLTRALDEKSRAAGRMRELCSRMIARGDDPTDDDLEVAVEESPEPPPRELQEYLVNLRHGRIRRKPGPKASPRTTSEDLFIQSAYLVAVEDIQERFAHEKRPAIRRMAKEAVADSLGLSVRTVERIIQLRPWTKDGKRIEDS